MSVFNFDGIEFNYIDDEKEGVPFIFLHGLGGDVSQTLNIMNEIPNIRRISIDFRGHGQTINFGGESKFNFNQFSDDVKELIDYLNIESFIIGGISTGAGVALNFAVRYPAGIKKLILSRPAWTDEPQPLDIRNAFNTIYWLLNNDKIYNKKEEFKQTSIYKKMNHLSSYAGKTLLSQFDYPYAKFTSKKLKKMPSDCPSYEKKNWEYFTFPSLIIASKLDPLHPFEFAEYLYEYIPSSMLKEVTSKTISGVQHKIDSVREVHDFIVN